MRTEDRTKRHKTTLLQGRSETNTVVLIVPGYRENLHYKSYRKIVGSFEERGIHAEFIRIVWKYKTISDFVLQVLEACRKHSQRGICLMGYSYGAFIAFLTAPFVNPRRLFLCSTSPFFKEDASHLERTLVRFLGKRRLDEIRKISFNTYAKFMPQKTVIVVGGEESKQLIHRSKIAHRLIATSILRVIGGVDHELNNPGYIDTVKGLI